MKNFIRENLKLIVAVTALLFLTIALVGGNEILAQTLPEISKFHIVRCNLENENYEYGYTGEEIAPKVVRVVLADEEGNVTVMYADDIAKVEYTDNVKVGMADAKLSFVGYNGSLSYKEAFVVVPSKVEELKVKEATKEAITLEWKENSNADGYFVYKSIDAGETHELVATIEGKDVLTYQDTDMKFNAIFAYYVCAYKDIAELQFVGLESDSVKQVTPLATPKLTSVSSVAHNKLVLKWERVDGAVGYQVFKSTTKKGEYDCVADIKDGAIVTYTDTKCELGKEYFYYIKACQKIDEQEFYGDASTTVKAQTKPASVKITGSTTGGTAVKLTWKTSEKADGYEVYRSVGHGGAYQLAYKAEKGDILSWSQSELEKGTNYFYRVRPFSIVDGKIIYGNYSNTYQKHAIIEYNYTPGSGMDFLRQYAGYKYTWGGTSPTTGWDCSGFVQWVYRNYFGISVGRTASAQASGGTSVSLGNRASWKPGDILLYRGAEGRISHAGIYLGGGEMIHALSPKYKTIIQSVDYYEKWDPETTLVCVKRYLP